MNKEMRDSKGRKLYPFNGTKHEHDIEFRCNRVSNELREMQTALEFGGRKHTAEEFNKVYDLHETLEDLLCKMTPGIVWLTGKEIALAKETIAWAAETRSNTQLRKKVYNG